VLSPSADKEDGSAATGASADAETHRYLIMPMRLPG
jgi:hypothetical protein